MFRCEKTAATANQDTTVLPKARAPWEQEGSLNFRRRVTHSQAQLKRQTLAPEVPMQLSAAANLPLPLWEGRAQARSWQVGQGKKQSTRPRTALTSLGTRPPAQPCPRSWATRRCRRSRAEPSPWSLPRMPGSGTEEQGVHSDSPGINQTTVMSWVVV